MAPPALLYALSTEPKLVGGNHGRSRSVAVCAEQAAQIGHDCSRVVMQLPPGDPDDPPPGGLKDPIAGAVALEGSSRSVKRVSVQLGDHPLGQPHTVPFDPPALTRTLRLTSGRGKPAWSSRARKRSSSSLRVIAEPTHCAARM